MRVPWRRLIQFRLRTLLIVSIAFSAVGGYYFEQVRRQANAAAEIVALGGAVTTDIPPGSD